MKEYPLDEDEIWELAALGLLTTAFLAVGSMCIGLYINVGMTLDFAQGADLRMVGRWEANRWWAGFGAVVFYLLSAVAFLAEGAKIWRIYSTTKHPDADSA